MNHQIAQQRHHDVIQGSRVSGANPSDEDSGPHLPAAIVRWWGFKDASHGCVGRVLASARLRLKLHAFAPMFEIEGLHPVARVECGEDVGRGGAGTDASVSRTEAGGSALLALFAEG